MKRIIYLTIISISVLIFSCETKTDIGYDILPEDDILDLYISDTTSIEVYTLRMDSIATNNVSTLMVGEYLDPIFGYSKASFVCEYGLVEYPNFTSDHTFTSVVLTLPLDDLNTYGNPAIVQNITVYRLENNLDEDTTYFAEHNPDEFITGTIIGEFSYTPNISDTAIYIPLSQEFGQELFELPDTITDDLFKDMFKGVYIKSESVDNNGSIIKTAVNTKSVITVYAEKIEDEITVIDSFRVSSDLISNVRFNMFDHDYSTTSFYTKIDDETGPQDSVAYIQAMGGLRTKIKIPFIEDLKELGDIAIYRAELVINTAPSAITEEDNFPVIENMLLTGYDPENEYYLLPEYMSATGYIGVVVNENSYSFDIGGYIRDILDGNLDNNGLLLFAYSGSTNFGRSVITTGNHSDRMKLYITYAKL